MSSGDSGHPRAPSSAGCGFAITTRCVPCSRHRGDWSSSPAEHPVLCLVQSEIPESPERKSEEQEAVPRPLRQPHGLQECRLRSALTGPSALGRLAGALPDACGPVGGHTHGSDGRRPPGRWGPPAQPARTRPPRATPGGICFVEIQLAAQKQANRV